MTIQHLFPTAKPTLDLNFAGERSLDPRITFSRSSIGTYVDEDGIIRYAAEDEPRFDHDGGTGESLGLLIEEKRTNVFLDNHRLLDVRDNGTASPTTGPDGNPSSATRITATAAGRVQAGNAGDRNITWSNSVKTTWSFYFKPSNTTAEIVGCGATSGAGQGGADFNYVTLESTLSGSSGKPREAAKIIPVGNGWFRCWVRYNDTMDSTANYRMNFNFQAGAASEYIDVCFAQVEEGEFLTSYIPTNGTAEDRAADLASISGTNLTSWYNQNAGTIFSIADRTGVTGSNQLVWHFRNGGRKEHAANSTAFQFYDVPGYGSGNFYRFPYTPNKQYKGVYAFETNSAVSALGGVVAIDVEATTYTPTVHDHLSLGSNYLVNSFLCGHISRFAYYPRRLSNEQLEALTS